MSFPAALILVVAVSLAQSEPTSGVETAAPQDTAQAASVQAPAAPAVPEYMTWDANLFYDRPAYRLGFQVDNLTDKRFWSPEYLQAGAPRRFIGNVTYKF